MSTLYLDMPVFVWRHKGEYLVRPLFQPDLVASGRTFRRASRHCAEKVREAVKNGLTDPLLLLSPELRVETVELAVSFEDQIRVTVASFVLHGVRWTVLPRFDNHVFAASGASRWTAFLGRLQDEARSWVRQRKKQENLEISACAFQRGDMVTTVGLTLAFEPPRLPFEPPDLAAFFAAMGGGAAFDGANELRTVARDLNLAFPDALQRAWTPRPEVDTLVELLARPRPTPTVLLGPRGAGRTTLVHEAVHRALEAHGTTALDRARKVWHLDPTRVTSGMSRVGDWQRRVEAICDFLQARLQTRYTLRDRPDALFVDNAVALALAGRNAGSRLAMTSVLRPRLKERRFGMVVEATTGEWSRLEELDRPFTELFQVVRVPAPSRAEAIDMVLRSRSRIEEATNTSMSPYALRRLLELVRRFPGDTVMPGAAVDVLRRLAVRNQGRTLTHVMVDASFVERSGLKPELLQREAPIARDGIVADLRARLVGQAAAVDALADVVVQVIAGVGDGDKPVASMLFVGPTGVGKTEAAKVLCDALFTSRDHLVRFNMNEYVDPWAASRLLGGPGREGQLTARLRHQPSCVLLLDEIEKAHPSVHDLLLQALDEGRLTDHTGRLVRFTQAIVILTSNVGAREAGRTVGFDQGRERIMQAYRTAVAKAFRPEFVNRLSRVVPFAPLGPDDIGKVAVLQLDRLLHREGFSRRVTIVDVRPDALAEVVQQGFDPRMGARAMKRALERLIVAPLAHRLLQAAHEAVAQVRVDRVEGELVTEIRVIDPVDPLPELEVEVADDEARRAALRALLSRVEAALPEDGGAVAVAGPAGIEAFHATESSLRTELIEALESLEEEPDEPSEVVRAVRISASRPVRRPDRFDSARVSELRGFLDIREYMLSCLKTGSRRAREERPLLPLDHVRFVLDHRDDPGCRLVMRSLNGAPLSPAAKLLSAYGGLCLRPELFQRQTEYRRYFYGTADRPDDAPAGFIPPVLTIPFEEPGARVLLQGEVGLHLWHRADGPPLPIQVELIDLVDEDQHLVPESTSIPHIVRVYTGSPGGSRPGTVGDLRTGEVVLMDRFDAHLLLRWLHAARTGP